MSDDFLPTRDEAEAFAVMLSAGVPPAEGIIYFFDEKDAAFAALDRWMTAPAVRAAITELQGKAWQKLTPDERIQVALNKHYAELAYFLYSRNYVDLQGADKTKADTCRITLETKQAGLAGKMEPLAQFWDDIKTGRVKLNMPVGISPAPVPPHQS